MIKAIAHNSKEVPMLIHPLKEKLKALPFTRMDGEAILGFRLRAISTLPRTLAAVMIRPTRSCRASTTLPRYSSAGCTVRFRVGFNSSISIITSTNSRFASTGDAPRLVVCSFTASHSKP